MKRRHVQAMHRSRYWMQCDEGTPSAIWRPWVESLRMVDKSLASLAQSRAEASPRIHGEHAHGTAPKASEPDASVVPRMAEVKAMLMHARRVLSSDASAGIALLGRSVASYQADSFALDPEDPESDHISDHSATKSFSALIAEQSPSLKAFFGESIPEKVGNIEQSTPWGSPWTSPITSRESSRTTSSHASPITRQLTASFADVPSADHLLARERPLHQLSSTMDKGQVGPMEKMLLASGQGEDVHLARALDSLGSSPAERARALVRRRLPNKQTPMRPMEDRKSPSAPRFSQSALSPPSAFPSVDSSSATPIRQANGLHDEFGLGFRSRH